QHGWHQHLLRLLGRPSSRPEGRVVRPWKRRAFRRLQHIPYGSPSRPPRPLRSRDPARISGSCIPGFTFSFGARRESRRFAQGIERMAGSRLAAASIFLHPHTFFATSSAFVGKRQGVPTGKPVGAMARTRRRGGARHGPVYVRFLAGTALLPGEYAASRYRFDEYVEFARGASPLPRYRACRVRPRAAAIREIF